MAWWWWIVPAVVGVFGLFLVIGGVAHAFRGRFFKGGRGIVGGAVFSLAGLAAGLLGLNVQTYNRLTYERPVAIVSARALAPQHFSVTMCQPSGDIQVYDVHGDQWRLEAFVLKWKPWANVLGLDAQYQLDRFSGRYITTEAELHGQRSVYGLRQEQAEPKITDPASWTDLFTKGINVLALPEPLQKYTPAVDTRYGNGVFMPLADGVVHQVWFTQDSMIAREGTPEDAAACAASATPAAASPT